MFHEINKSYNIYVVFFLVLDNTARAESNEKEPRALTDKEIILFNTLIYDDFNTFINTGSSFMEFDYINVTSRQMYSVYKRNQARGNNQFKGKPIIISGVVKSIKSSIGDIPYVVLESGNIFESVQITFSKKHRNMALNLDKGDEIKYACIGGGIIIGNPTLRDCKPISEVRDDIIRELNEKIKNIEIKKENKKILSFYLVIREVVSIDSQILDCKQNEISCIDPFFEKYIELKNTMKNKLAPY